MIVLLSQNISSSQENIISSRISSFGLKVSRVSTKSRTYLIATGLAQYDIRAIGSLPGVDDVHIVSDQYKLVSRKWKTKRTSIDLGDGISIGGNSFQFIAGPCALESEDQITQVVNFLSKNNIRIMRGGAFKPRTSPYSFRGLGLEGLKLFATLAHEKNIKIISEVLEPAQIDAMYPYVDIFQVGARNSQNFSLLSELGKVDKPVLLKRGISGTIDELLQCAEYIFSSGNEKIILCERGIRTFETAYRNTFDINAVPVLKDKSHLPVFIDPSHGIGIRKFIEPITFAGIAAGADGALIEIHPTPEKSVSDSDQTIGFDEATRMIEKSRMLLEVITNA
jgi:3-deoxy-7-phosphoheptulonate synthase